MRATTTVPESYQCFCREVSGRLLARGQISVRSFFKLSKRGYYGPHPIRGAQLAVESAETMYDQCRYTRMTSLWAEWLVKPAQP